MIYHLRRKLPVVTNFKASGGLDFVIPNNNWEFETGPNTWVPCLSQAQFPDHFELNIDGAMILNVSISDMSSFVNAPQFVVSDEFPLLVPQVIGFGLSLGLTGGGIIIIT